LINLGKKIKLALTRKNRTKNIKTSLEARLLKDHVNITNMCALIEMTKVNEVKTASIPCLGFDFQNGTLEDKNNTHQGGIF